MHNLDRTLNVGEAESPYELEYEFEAEAEAEAENEFEFEFEFEAEQEGEFEALSEMEQLERAAELLEVSNEQELEYFLGDLINSAGKAIRNFANSGVGKAVGGIAKGALKTVLPIAGGALGTFVGGPVGGALGSMAANKAGQLLGLELEGLSHDDREFEVAKQLVRLTGDAAHRAAATAGSGPPEQVARHAFIEAAHRHAPGLLRAVPRGESRPHAPAAYPAAPYHSAGGPQVAHQAGAPRSAQVTGRPPPPSTVAVPRAPAVQTRAQPPFGNGIRPIPMAPTGQQQPQPPAPTGQYRPQVPGSPTGQQQPQPPAPTRQYQSGIPTAPSPWGMPRSGRWVRHNSKIVLMGV
jgi:hypothetical protein